MAGVDNDSEDGVPTQFERALLQLNIEPICATSPQAKGRVERLFQTLQDRLVKALRLAGISDMDKANAWLPEYLAQHNQRFAVAQRNEGPTCTVRGWVARTSWPASARCTISANSAPS